MTKKTVQFAARLIKNSLDRKLLRSAPIPAPKEYQYILNQGDNSG